MQYLQYVVFGLVTGSILLLGTVGFSMIRRVDNFLNITHGQMVAVGAYLGYVFYMLLSIPILLAVLLTLIVMGVLGWLQFKGIFAPVRRHGSLNLIFTSVGLAYFVHGGVQAIFGGKPKPFVMPTMKMFYIGNRPMISTLEIIIIGIAALSSVAIHLYLTRTRAGVALRAMSSEYDLARVCGINTDSVSAQVWVIATVMAGLAGILMGMRGTIYSDMGWQITLLILSAAVMGGLGSFYGVMVGAVLIGLGMDLSVIFINPAYRFAVAFAVIIVVLVVKPRGILGGGSHG